MPRIMQLKSSGALKKKNTQAHVWLEGVKRKAPKYSTACTSKNSEMCGHIQQGECELINKFFLFFFLS